MTKGLVLPQRGLDLLIGSAGRTCSPRSILDCGADRAARSVIRRRADGSDRRNRRRKIHPAGQPWTGTRRPRRGRSGAGRRRRTGRRDRLLPPGSRPPRLSPAGRTRAGSRGRSWVVRRITGRDGRSRAFINDQPVGVGLRRLGALLVEVQDSTTDGAGHPSGHAGFLDAFGADRNRAQRRRILARLARRTRPSVLARRAIEAAQRDEEGLRHAADELATLAPREGEEDRLAEERLRLQQAERRAEAIAASLSELTPRDRRSTWRLAPRQRKWYRGAATAGSAGSGRAEPRRPCPGRAGTRRGRSTGRGGERC